MVLLSATLIPNILEYIRVSLKFSQLLQIYKQLCDHPNLTYIVSLIRQAGFKAFEFFIPSGRAVGKIPKTIIFVDKIDNAVEMAKYLQLKFPKQIWNKKDLEDIIYTFLTNFTITSRSRFLANLQSDNTQIWIYTECAGININLPDIYRAV